MQTNSIDRDPRVRFKHPVRVVPIGGPPRAYRVLASNISKEGMFLRMPTPFDAGTRVALSLEAGGRVLPFAQAEVVWRDLEETKAPGCGAGFGVRFTGFLHPRAHELVDYLVANLDSGKPLNAPQAASPWRKPAIWAAIGLAAILVGAGITTAVLRFSRSAPPVLVEAPPAELAVPTIEGVSPVVELAPAPAPVSPKPDAVPEPVAAAEPVAAVEPAAVAKPAVAAKPSVHAFVLSAGAVRSITASTDAQTLSVDFKLNPGAALVRAFTLKSPDRLVVDVKGAIPKKALTFPGSGATILKVRSGKLPRGTRIVLDLANAPGKPVVVSGNSVSVPLH